MRLIDIDEFDYENIMCSQDQLHWLNRMVEKQPAVDAVPVVRCKDCKHYVLQACACRHENFNGIISLDGYCSYGERKDND